MSARDHLLALNEELRRLKSAGQRAVPVTDESLAQLRAALAGNRTPPAATPAATTAEAGPPVPSARRAAPATDASSASIPAVAPVVELPAGDKATRWAALRELVVNHPVCRAHVRPGKQVVLGVGSLEAQIFFCGEAPGADEEVQGEPFVGPAGQLLTKMIQAMGLKREQVYIGNIMNWRPEMPAGPAGVQGGNRPPTPEEMNFCLPFLRAQLGIVQPRLIVALGATAAGGLLGHGTFKTLGEIKGRWHEFGGTPVMVTYHPSYILRNNSNRSKRGIWEDLLKVMERTALPVSDKQRNYFL